MASELQVDTPQLDAMQAEYKAAVHAWVNAIQHEEALASNDHSIGQVDEWEEAGCQEEALRNQAKAAKKKYEEAIREKFYHFDVK